MNICYYRFNPSPLANPPPSHNHSPPANPPPSTTTHHHESSSIAKSKRVKDNGNWNKIKSLLNDSVDNFYTIQFKIDVEMNVYGTFETSEQEVCTPMPTVSNTANPLPPRSRKNRSEAWDHFTVEPGEEKKAKCYYCGTIIKCDNGTSAMIAHWRRCQNIPTEGKYFHTRCCAHVLNLIMKDGLKDIDNSVLRIRGAVKYIQSSDNRYDKFKTCIDPQKVEYKGFVNLDGDTR
ncbi:hypothetical protein TSUD_313790 [Trifolium subterraneum]|uniref:BED-type domain-containing protein n=1 Tax=Trifolium subterraneum TaxID=3900 RepID=A0A2Z6NCE0_TRISU|nr:hypothetical protein TSUD_313790 [Trifolium subterraneum]